MEIQTLSTGENRYLAADFLRKRPGIFNGVELLMEIVNLDETVAVTTKDGSEIRELLAHRNSSIRQQSLAEARVPPGCLTLAHYHPKTEEIYYLLRGTGQMRISDEWREVRVGDAIAIPPGEVHQIRNNGAETLVFLCCCAPGYEHEDTVICEAETGETETS